MTSKDLIVEIKRSCAMHFNKWINLKLEFSLFQPTKAYELQRERGREIKLKKAKKKGLFLWIRIIDDVYCNLKWNEKQWNEIRKEEDEEKGKRMSLDKITIRLVFPYYKQRNERILPWIS